MAKKRKSKWEKKATCGCVKAELSVGRVMVRCERHRGKSSKRVLCYWDEGQVRLEA